MTKNQNIFVFQQVNKILDLTDLVIVARYDKTQPHVWQQLKKEKHSVFLAKNKICRQVVLQNSQTFTKNSLHLFGGGPTVFIWTEECKAKEQLRAKALSLLNKAKIPLYGAFSKNSLLTFADIKQYHLFIQKDLPHPYFHLQSQRVLSVAQLYSIFSHLVAKFHHYQNFQNKKQSLTTFELS